MKNLNSLALFVGTGECNAHCGHCAGVPLRKYAPKEDGIIYEELIRKTIEACYADGARSLSISSSGEPTLSPVAVTKVIRMLHNYKNKGLVFSSIHLYSNGIKIGTDRDFCNRYLTMWRMYGLNVVYVTVHDVDAEKNAKAYGVEKYPSLERIIERIHGSGLKFRANIVLSKNTIYSNEQFIYMMENLRKIGADSASAWPVRDMNDKVDKLYSPSEEELDKMESWIEKNNLQNTMQTNSQNKSDFKVKLLRENSRIAYTSGQKLTLFPDGTLSNTWCNY